MSAQRDSTRAGDVATTASATSTRPFRRHFYDQAAGIPLCRRLGTAFDATLSKTCSGRPNGVCAHPEGGQCPDGVCPAVLDQGGRDDLEGLGHRAIRPLLDPGDALALLRQVLHGRGKQALRALNRGNRALRGGFAYGRMPVALTEPVLPQSAFPRNSVESEQLVERRRFRQWEVGSARRSVPRLHREEIMPPARTVRRELNSGYTDVRTTLVKDETGSAEPFSPKRSKGLLRRAATFPTTRRP